MEHSAQAKLITSLFMTQSIIVNYLHASTPEGADALLQNLESLAASESQHGDPTVGAMLALLPHFARTPSQTADLAKQLLSLLQMPKAPPQ